MVSLLKCLVNCSKTLSHFPTFQICPKPKVKLSPTDLIHPAPPSSLDIATARNPNNSFSSIRISVSPRWPCQRTVTCCTLSVSPSQCNRSHQDCLSFALFLITSLRSHRVEVIGHTELMFSLDLAHRSHRVVPVGPTDIPNVHILN